MTTALVLLVVYVYGFTWMMRQVRWCWSLWNVAFALTWPFWLLMWVVCFVVLFIGAFA